MYVDKSINNLVHHTDLVLYIIQTLSYLLDCRFSSWSWANLPLRQRHLRWDWSHDDEGMRHLVAIDHWTVSALHGNKKARFRVSRASLTHNLRAIGAFRVNMPAAMLCSVHWALFGSQMPMAFHSKTFFWVRSAYALLETIQRSIAPSPVWILVVADGGLTPLRHWCIL